MKRLLSAVAIIALLSLATTMLWSQTPSTDRHIGNTGMPSLQELYTTAGVSTLPNQDFEDQSLVFSTITKR